MDVWVVFLYVSTWVELIVSYSKFFIFLVVALCCIHICVDYLSKRHLG